VGQIVKLVNLSGLEVRIGRLGESGVKANSPLSILALKGKTGEELTLEIDTKDQELANDLVAHVQEILKGQPLD
jgi:phosphotransferase system HPr-like phosphotransfer protein